MLSYRKNGRRRDMNEIDGRDALGFVSRFDYIREAGTEGEERAAREIVSALEDLGEKPAVETFPIEAHTIERAVFRMTAPFEKEYRIAGYLRGGSTDGAGIDAPFYYAENGDDLSLRGAAGKIVLVNGPVRRPLYEKLTAAGAKAFLSVIGTPVDTGIDRIPSNAKLFPGADAPIPGGVIHIADAAEIVEAIGAAGGCLNDAPARAHLELTERRSEAVSRNVICRIEGSGLALKRETLALTAHFDSVPEGKGAYDNIAACGILYSLIGYFRAHRPKRSLEFVFFGAEEKGLCGSREYCRRHADALENCRFAMNIDLAGQTVGGNVFGVTADARVDEVLLGYTSGTGIGVTVRNAVWSSDSNSFAATGIPAMTLNRDGFGMHTRHDTLGLISAWSLERSARLLCAVAQGLADAEPFPFERRVPDEYLAQLRH